MGRVYKAMQSPLERLVALKVLNPRYAGEKDPGFEQRFFREAAVTAKLHHPNTVTVHDYGRTEDGMLFIAMEFLEGETLQQLLARVKTVSWPRALQIVAQVARSLREAHKLGVIHRDLKPANVMVLNEETGSDLVKVLDFGLVKTFLNEPQQPAPSPELTQAGVLLGSPLYMAPEAARNEADPRSDIYSMGVLLYQTLTGRPPFTGKDSIDIIVKHIREKPQSAKHFKPDLPDEVDGFVMRCLAKEPIDRYQSMDDVLEALRGIASSAGMSGAFTDPRSLIVGSSSAVTFRPSAPPGPPRPGMATHSIEVPLDASLAVTAPRRFPLPVYVVGAVVAAVVVIGGAALLTRRSKAVAPVAPVPVAVVQPPEPLAAPPRPVVEAPAEVLVTFEVTSAPVGATVTMDGKTVGVTPFSLPLKAEADGNLRVQLGFSLDGYQGVTVTAEGRGTVAVNQVMKKKGKKRVVKDNGFKDDPYQ
ncbi:MAG: serine/threonine protein kinase [Archangiaceae bacterium]|nr:serine/threonine protein kinase [Archangiaceae bacterium]